jgi:hypothetical protein
MDKMGDTNNSTWEITYGTNNVEQRTMAARHRVVIPELIANRTAFIRLAFF